MTDNEVMREIKTLFVEKLRSLPAFKGLNPKAMWRDIEKMISLAELRAPFERDKPPALRPRIGLLISPVASLSVRAEQELYRAITAALRSDSLNLGPVIRGLLRKHPELTDTDGQELLRILTESVSTALKNLERHGNRNRWESNRSALSLEPDQARADV